MKSEMVYLVISIFIRHTLSDKSDIGLNPGEIIKNHGYPLETHEVVTQDGYILTVYRIPHGINNTTIGAPVLLVHGFTACSSRFVELGPSRGLGFILANKGYDVWLINTRGTQYSRNHTRINVNTDPEAYFNFTWHEIGIYDISSTIDHILQNTGYTTLYYIGHSQGTTVFLVLTSMKPEYNNKIKFASLMAPVAFLEHIPNFLVRVAAKFTNQIWSVLKFLRIYEIPFSGLIRKTVKTLCTNYPNRVPNPFCYIVYESQFPHVNKSDLAVIYSSNPANSGLKQYAHYGQIVKTGRFRQFDHGTTKNLKVYGTETPPDYNLSNVLVPIAFYYAKKDKVVNPKDEIALVKRIPKVNINYLVPKDDFSHTDFATSNDVVKLVYDKLITVMLNFLKYS